MNKEIGYQTRTQEEFEKRLVAPSQMSCRKRLTLRRTALSEGDELMVAPTRRRNVVYLD